MNILVTGGAGFIGSHTVVELLQAGNEVVIIDNLCNSSTVVLGRLEKICNRSIQFVQGDVRDRAVLDYVFGQYEIDIVIHFAGLKAVGESVEKPLSYFDNNVSGTITLCQAMAAAGVFNMVFSSSATVYGDAMTMPLNENIATKPPTNPYGRSKLMVEEILRDLSQSDSRWSIALLRYFNPVGAHESGLIGENPRGIPNNLLPYIAQVASCKLKQLAVFGDDYPTPDGTGVRDYIHVVDLAIGHVKTLSYVDNHSGVYVWNLGTGQGYSVLEMVRAFEVASGRTVPYVIEPRRSGDIAQCWSDPSKAKRDLGWQAERDLSTMMVDAWRWQQMNTD